MLKSLESGVDTSKTFYKPELQMDTRHPDDSWKITKRMQNYIVFFIIISVQEQVDWNIAPDERDKFGYRIAKENASAATSKFTLGLSLIFGFEIKKNLA